MRDALLWYGIKHLNGRAFRSYIEHWWFDASAKALGEGYRKYTKALGVEGRIQSMSYEELLPGDLAVTSSGRHVLSYVGDGRWVQADPGSGKVLTLDGRLDDNGWFRLLVYMHRWRLLDVDEE